MKHIFLLPLLMCFQQSFAQKSEKPSDITTPNGNIISFIERKDSIYLQWKIGHEVLTLNTLPFDKNGADAWFPRYMAENSDYILLRAGCGNPCWTGIVLPLKEKKKKPIFIHEYLGFDLDQKYIAYVDDSMLTVLNFKTMKTESFSLGKCESVFIGYCAENVRFEKNMLCLEWYNTTFINSKEKETKRFRLKI